MNHSEPPPVVALRAAGMVFGNGVRALAPTDLAIGAGEFVSLIGPSGCGKSTLLKLVAQLHEPTDGRIAWWGRDVRRVGEAGRRLAFVFQDPTLMPWADVATNVRLPLDLARVPRGEASERVVAALRQVGLADRHAERPHRLSGGMRMRVSIARALVTDPDLLLMDEPFGALDEFTRNRLDEDLLALAADRQLTTLFVTHSIGEAAFLSSRVLVMAAAPGRIVAEYRIEQPPHDAATRLDERYAEHCRCLSRLLHEASGGVGGRA
ncbi:ABC transporter ATP-binding protein [Lichenicoccus sp.]|uniref:ABC transporter ATP-binding protein n=1 Tax=Lichenicoccus sp. TaxID=2781899 RepID=UPI003D1001AF